MVSSFGFKGIRQGRVQGDVCTPPRCQEQNCKLNAPPEGRGSLEQAVTPPPSTSGYGPDTLWFGGHVIIYHK